MAVSNLTDFTVSTTDCDRPTCKVNDRKTLSKLLPSQTFFFPTFLFAGSK